MAPLQWPKADRVGPPDGSWLYFSCVIGTENGGERSHIFYLKEGLQMSTMKHLSGKAGRSSLRKARTLRAIFPGGNRQFASTSHARLRVERLEDRVVLSPVVLDPNLGVRTVVGNLTQPTSMAFLGQNDFFVLEKTTGKVDHVINGVETTTKFDFGSGPIDNLPVNFASERGLLGVALSPNFTNDHDVYLYWTQSSTRNYRNLIKALFTSALHSQGSVCLFCRHLFGTVEVSSAGDQGLLPAPRPIG